MRYEIMTGCTYTRIDQFKATGEWERTVYVHRAEYRHWDA